MHATNLLQGCRVLVLSAAALSGCGRPVTTLEGSVTLDGHPLQKGSILLVPADGKGQTAGDGIVNGRYRLRVSPGTMNVQIRSPKVGGKVRDPGDPAGSTMVDQIVEAVPARYNDATALQVTLQPGTNRKDFALETGDR